MVLIKEHLWILAVSIWSWSTAPTATAFEGRIVNGSQALEGEFPFVVSLRRSSSGRHSCGASLLNRVWVLTAAHCVTSSQPSHINIQYGSNELNANSTHVANISQIYVHENYTPSDLHVHDIALLRLATPVTFGAKVRGVHLPATQQPTPDNSSAVLIGWGLNATGGSAQTQLQKVRLQIFGDEECSARHQTQLHATTICAGVPEGGRGQCSGDSGGPLLVNGTQVGIVSWSRKPCTRPPYPGVFTEVSAYVDWIQAIMSRNPGDWDESDESLEELQSGNLIIVSLRHTGSNGHFCAGTIIAPKWVLTAAHCFTYIHEPQQLWIQHSSNKLLSEAFHKATVKEIVKHEGYSSTLAIHDIALLKLSHQLSTLKNLPAVNLAKTEQEIELGNATVTLVGWGLNSTTGSLQRNLQKVSLQLYTSTACRERVNAVMYKTQLCAGPRTNHMAGQCSGDSGGPLLLNAQQIGIVSWSLKPCGSYPGIFTNVALYWPWINETIHRI